MFQFKPLSLKAKAFLKHANAKINLAVGAIRSGKTIVVNIAWDKYLKSQPPGLTFLMSGRTKEALYRNVIEDFLKMVGNDAHYDAMHGILYYAGQTIRCVGADDQTQWMVIRGDTFAGWYGDEITLQNEKFVKEAIGRLSEGAGRIYWTANPDSPNHYLAKEYVFNAALRLSGLIKVFQFTLEDNLALSPDYVDTIKQLYTGVWYKRLILGLWVLAEGAIYEMLDVSKGGRHLWRPDMDLGKPLRRVLGGDYGTASVTTYVDLIRFERAWVCVNEYYWDAKVNNRQKTDNELIDDLAQFITNGPVKMAPELMVMDSAATSWIATCNQRRVIHAVTANKDVVPGIKYISGLLGNRNLLIAPNCRNTIREMSGYIWDAKAQEAGEDKPVKRNDHTCDAIRYPIYTLHASPRQIMAAGNL